MMPCCADAKSEKSLQIISKNYYLCAEMARTELTDTNAIGKRDILTLKTKHDEKIYKKCDNSIGNDDVARNGSVGQ